MPEQKLVVPACPRRENGHLWRFDRERSTTDCQADVGAAGVGADRGVDQVAAVVRGGSIRSLGRGDHGERRVR